MAVNISISVEFLQSLVDLNLPKNVQAKTIKFFEKFIANPDATGLHTEKINRVDEKQLYSSRVDENYRCISYKEKGIKTDTYHLLWIAHHDDAYRKAELAKKIKTSNLMVRSRNYYEKFGLSKTKTPKLFAAVSEKELKALGVTEANLFSIRNVENIEQLQTLKELFSDIVYGNLELIAIKEHVKDVLEYNQLIKKELITILDQEIFEPSMNCHILEQDIKSSIINTKEIIERKKSVETIIEYYYDALISKRGKTIKENLNNAGLKAFEDIEGTIRDFCRQIGFYRSLP
jgi:hypothetical protein